MIIAVSMRVSENQIYPETRDAISHDWVRMLDSLGISPVFVPNCLKNTEAFIRKFSPKGLILIGGEDISPDVEFKEKRFLVSGRDRTELELLEFALIENLPVFGTCRGMQLINVYFGGSLNRDISALGSHVATNHPVEFVKFPYPENIKDNNAITNSYHNQGICEDNLAAGLEVLAVAENGVIEGFMHPDLPVVAVQWHPERDNPAADIDRMLIKGWLARCE